MAISADGKLIASGSADKTVKVWDEVTGQVKFTLSEHRGAVNSVAMSADGQRLVSASDDGTVKVWDGATGKVFTLEGHKVVPIRGFGGNVKAGNEIPRGFSAWRSAPTGSASSPAARTRW